MPIALVLLPGMDGTGELFAPLLAQLGQDVDATVVRYPDRRASYAEHEAVARRELPKDQPFVILGESFSGPIAVSIAANAPPNLRGLILCVSFLTCPHALLRVLRPFTSIATPKLVPGFIAHHSLLGRFATPALRAAHTEALRQVSSATLTARLRAMADVDVREKLARVELPALYLRAARDRVVAARYGDEFLKHARSGRLVDLDGPHFLLQTQPADCARQILKFAAELH